VKRSPKQLDKIHQEVNNIVAEYFNSIETSFTSSVKLYGKSHPFSQYVFGPIIVLFLLTLIPVVPAIINSQFPGIFPPQISLFKWTISVSSFFYWWGLLFILVFGLFKLGDRIDDKFRNDRKSRTIPYSEMPFCLLYSSAKEIRAYQVNRRKQHLQSAEKMLNIYFETCEINLSTAQIKDNLVIKSGLIPQKLISTQLVGLLKSAHTWFILADQTNSVLEAFANFKSHLVERVSQGIELDRVLFALEPLYLYEFARGKRESQHTLVTSSVSLSDLSGTFLSQYAHFMNTISALPKQETTKPQKIIDSINKKIWAKLTFLLAHENPLACFLSWYLILLVIFSLPLLIGFALFMPLNSTIVIGIFSAPFAGAIAITTAVYSKKHDKK
jgi:hypothetical protein